MDCERFAEVALDALYDELDEPTLATFRRHADGCARCQASFAGLRAVRRVAVLPRVEVPPSVTDRILAAAQDARRRLPWHRRAGQLVSWAGAYAMRPQVAMGALLVLMLGSSLMLLRTRRGERATLASRVSVTEHGAPEAERSAGDRASARPAASVALDEALLAGGVKLGRRDDDRVHGEPAAAAPSFAAPASGKAARAAEADDEPDDAPAAPAAPRASAEPAASATPAAEGGAPAAPSAAVGAAAEAEPAPDPYAAAMALYKAGRFADAAREFELVAGAGGRNAALASLYAARSVQQTSGCSVAAPRYEAVAARFPGTAAAGDALWAAAACQRSMGNFERARDLYLSLRTVAGYRDRAEAELANLAAALPAVGARRGGARR